MDGNTLAVPFKCVISCTFSGCDYWCAPPVVIVLMAGLAVSTLILGWHLRPRSEDPPPL